ncbi:MAG: hypothetical protein JWM34_3147 [Ilumatobacteraceae bacterium]|nr:hypothetical protein [Ilumatobacteraceae bacterium]
MPSESLALTNDWFARHNGVASLATLTTLGLSRSAVYRRVDRGALKVLQPGVFQSTQWPTDDIQLLTAMCARSSHIAVGFTTAAREWTFRSMPKDRLLHVVVPHGFSPMLTGAVVHRSRRIDLVDIVERDDGIRLTSPTRTLFDVADFVGDIVAASILEQLISDGRGTMATHVATVARLGHAQRHGSQTMARVIESRPKWSEAMQSGLEAKVLAEILRQQLPTPIVQFRLDLRGGGWIRFDFAWPDQRVALEVDHPFWHAGGEASHLDKQRDRLAAMEGWSTMRVTSLDVEHGLRLAIEQVATILRRSR